jgi:hypothetical protein
MIMTNMIKKLGTLLFLTSLLILSACGGGGGGGAPLETPIGDVSGNWRINDTSTSTNSACNEVTQSTLTFSQSGNTGTVTDQFGNVFTGTISGNTISWSGSYPDAPGTTTINSLSGTIAPSCNSLNGTSTWSYVETGFSCSGTSVFTGTRINPIGCGTGGGGGTIPEVEPNDLPSEAQIITLPVTITGSMSNIDTDGFEFTLTGAQTITATLTGGTTTDMDLFLFNAVGPVIIDASTGFDSNESITSPLGAGSFQVVILPFDVPTTTSYTLTIQ